MVLAVNETTLNNTVDDLEELLTEEVDKQSNLRRVLYTLKTIKKNPNGTFPFDIGTDAIMSSSRRNSVYNACIQEGINLVNAG